MRNSRTFSPKKFGNFLELEFVSAYLDAGECAEDNSKLEGADSSTSTAVKEPSPKSPFPAVFNWPAPPNDPAVPHEAMAKKRIVLGRGVQKLLPQKTG